MPYLSRSAGLHDASPDAICLLGKLVDRMIGPDDHGIVTEDGRRALHGIGRAKAFKWLTAWAPDYVPMIDSYVASALIDMEPANRSIGAEQLLIRFQKLLKSNLPALTQVTHRFT
jgi:hypothetical protein